MSPLSTGLLIASLGTLCVLSAAASALETALLCLKEHHVKSLAGNNKSLLNAIGSFSRKPQRQLNHVILLTTVLQLGITAIILFLLHEATFPWELQPAATAIILFAAVIVFTEVVPTLIGTTQPAAVFRLTARPLLFLNPILNPLAESLIRLTEKTTALLLPKRLEPRGDFTQEELETLVEVRCEEGILEEGESDVIQEILKLGHKTAKDCMTPRVDAVVISNELSPEEADDFIRKQNHRHIPVYRDSRDTIIGILNVKDFLSEDAQDYRAFVRPPVFVPETMPALDVFKDFLREPRSLAIVLDEFGGMEGVISQTDIIEQLIGDAAPQPEHALEIQDLGKSRLLVAGSARLDEIGEILDLDLESEGLDTIGGLLYNATGRLPAPGERIELDGIIATIRRCGSKRIEEVLIEKAK